MNYQFLILFFCFSWSVVRSIFWWINGYSLFYEFLSQLLDMFFWLDVAYVRLAILIWFTLFLLYTLFNVKMMHDFARGSLKGLKFAVFVVFFLVSAVSSCGMVRLGCDVLVYLVLVSHTHHRDNDYIFYEKYFMGLHGILFFMTSLFLIYHGYRVSSALKYNISKVVGLFFLLNLDAFFKKCQIYFFGDIFCQHNTSNEECCWHSLSF